MTFKCIFPTSHLITLATAEICRKGGRLASQPACPAVAVLHRLSTMPPINVFDACRDGKIKELEAIIATGKVDLNQKDYWGQTPLYHAMQNNHPAIVKLLLDEPSIVLGTEDNNGVTALMAASERNC